MTMTFQAIVIVLGLNWVLNSGASNAVIFIMSLLILILEERRVSRPVEEVEIEIRPEESTGFNEDSPDWEA